MTQDATDREHLQRAIELACQSVASGGGPFGAVVVRDGRVVGEGMNRVHPHCDPSAHAEVVAIRAASQALGHPHLTGCTLYASCEPCPMCAGAIHWAHIERVLFAADGNQAADAGFDDRRFRDEMQRDPGQRALSFEQLAMEEASEPFRRWKASDVPRY